MPVLMRFLKVALMVLLTVPVKVLLIAVLMIALLKVRWTAPLKGRRMTLLPMSLATLSRRLLPMVAPTVPQTLHQQADYTAPRQERSSQASSG
jgi:hypothetical protein